MKYLLALLISGALAVSGYSQTRNVLVNSNNAVVSPTNFWSVDASNARTGLGLGTAATNPASAFQPSSGVLSNLASSNAVNLTNLRATNIVGVIPASNISSLSLTNITGTLAISNGGSGATTAGGARTNLELGATWLTNTVASNFRTSIGLGAIDQVSFSNIQVGSADINPNPTNLSIKFDTNTTNIVGISGSSSFPKRIVFHVDGGTVSVFSNSISANNVSGTGIGVGSNGMTFNASGIYVTRSNLGLIGTGTNSVIGGGENNQSTGNASVVGGGDNNVSSNLNSTVSGGRNNTASGSRSTVAGGDGNTASGGFSFASGRRSQATNTGAFVFSDSTDADFSSTNDNSFNIRAGGGLSLDLGTNGIGFRNATNAAVTRTNLGLGASWLISTNTPVFVSTNGEVVSPTNFWQVAPIVTRFVEFQPSTNATTNIVAARNLHIHSLALAITGVTSTIALPTNNVFDGDIALVVHQGPTSSVTAIRQAGAGTNLITLNQPEEAVEFVYYNSVWQFNHNLSYVEPIFFSGTNAAANRAASRTNLGLGATNDVEFRTVKINLSTGAGDSLIVTNSGSSATSLFDDITVNELDAETAAFGNTVIVSSSGISFNTNTAAAITRTNLGLGATNDVTFSTLTLSSDLTLGSGDNIVLSTTNGTKIGTATNQLLGFYNQTPITQPSSTGVTTNGFTRNSGDNVHPQSTFTGGIGTNAYTISDVVAHLKSLGLLAP